MIHNCTPVLLTQRNEKLHFIIKTWPQMFTETYLLTAKKPNEPHFFQWVNS